MKYQDLIEEVDKDGFNHFMYETEDSDVLDNESGEDLIVFYHDNRIKVLTNQALSERAIKLLYQINLTPRDARLADPTVDPILKEALSNTIYNTILNFNNTKHQVNTSNITGTLNDIINDWNEDDE